MSMLDYVTTVIKGAAIIFTISAFFWILWQGVKMILPKRKIKDKIYKQVANIMNKTDDIEKIFNQINEFPVKEREPSIKAYFELKELQGGKNEEGRTEGSSKEEEATN